MFSSRTLSSRYLFGWGGFLNLVENLGKAFSAERILTSMSPRLIDEFQANRIVIVERDAKRPRTILHRLNEEDLGEWLESYCLSDLWEKNVLGGRP